MKIGKSFPDDELSAMKDTWNARYAAPEYIYGQSPNVFFAEHLHGLTPGRILLPADGEGRNAVFAAEQGWQVTAFDWSEQAQAKALRLAESRGVTIDFRVMDAAEAHFEPEFDLIALIYAHFPPPIRAAFHPKVAGFLKPGGMVVMEGYAKGQVEYQQRYQSGGPSTPAMLFSVDELRREMSGLTEVFSEEVEVVLNEGLLHQGLARVVRWKGVK